MVSFFSIEGQKERLANAVMTVKSVINPFKSSKVTAATGSPIVDKVLSAAASNPYIVAGGVAAAASGLAAGALKTVTSFASSVLPKAAPVVAKVATQLATKVVSSPTAQKVAASTAAVALISPKLITTSNVKSAAAFALNPVAAGTATVHKIVSEQKTIFTDPNTPIKEKVKLAAKDVLIAGAAVGTMYGGYEIAKSIIPVVTGRSVSEVAQAAVSAPISQPAQPQYINIPAQQQQPIYIYNIPAEPAITPLAATTESISPLPAGAEDPAKAAAEVIIPEEEAKKEEKAAAKPAAKKKKAKKKAKKKVKKPAKKQAKKKKKAKKKAKV